MTIGKVKFSQLPAQVESELNPNTIFAVVNLGLSKKATLTNVKNYLITDGLATQAYVDSAINNLVGNAPAILDTLSELAAAIGNDGNFYVTIQNMVDSAVAGLFPTKSTNDLAEGANNLYFTTDRARSSISVVDASNTLTYDPATGVFTFSAVDVPVLTVNGQTGDVVLDSDDIAEGSSNLYFTTARARSSLSSGTGISYDDVTGVIAIGQPIAVSDSPTFQNMEVFFNTSTQTLTVEGTDQSTSTSTGAVVVSGGVGIQKNLNVGGNTTIGGNLTAGAIITDTITHNGLVPTDGTNIDQIKTLTRSLRLLTSWQDVGINSSDLATGTYLVQIFANDLSAGGVNNNEYYSGIMSWYQGNTDSSDPQPTDEIPLHRAGGSNDGNLYLRTFRTATADPNNLKLQIYSNIEAASASNYVFKFRRVI
jgi:hypothetical protein